MKKIVSLATAALMLAATALPVFAASPSTSTVMNNPVSVATNVAAAKGYALNAAEQAAVATTPEQAVALSVTTVVESTNASNAAMAVAASPAVIAMAKADILKNDSIKTALARRGVAGNIIASQTIARADGKSARTRLNLSTAGLTTGQKVAILYYLPGDVTPRLAYPTWRNGKLRVTLPLPCEYNLVF